MNIDRALTLIRAADAVPPPEDPAADASGWNRLETAITRSPRRPTRLWHRPGVVVAITFAAVVGVGGTAAAASGGLLSLWPGGAGDPPAQVIRGSESATVPADKVRAYTASHPGSGYGAMKIDALAGSLTIFWKGSVPDALQAELATDPSVPIDFQPARDSADELTAGVARLHGAESALEGELGIALVSFTPGEDASGLTVGYTAVRPAITTEPHLRERLTTIANVDVKEIRPQTIRIFPGTAKPQKH